MSRDPNEWYKRRNLYYRYNLTVDEFQAKLDKQKGVCAICGSSNWGNKKNMPNVDHSHRTGKVRGLLCNKCNFGIGFFNDSPTRLMKAYAYLKKRKW